MLEVDVAEIINGDRVPLPAGYEYVDPDSITAEELYAIDLAVNGPSEEAAERSDWSAADDDATKIIKIGARSPDESCLVAIGLLVVVGSVQKERDEQMLVGMLTNFGVLPEHQRRGLGTAILHERLRIADRLGILNLMAELSPTNVLQRRYHELGFREGKDKNGYLFRSRSN